MIAMRLVRSSVVVAFAFGAACSNMRLRGSAPVDTGPFQRPPSTPTATRAGSGPSSELRRVCRGSNGRGWIAIDYITDEETCPAAKSRRKTFGTAVVMRYADVPINGELTVCADERVPQGWVREHEVLEGTQCAGDPPSDKPTVMVIRRRR
jgi:hypothetical protein